jgi:hypothetical protein
MSRALSAHALPWVPPPDFNPDPPPSALAEQQSSLDESRNTGSIHGAPAGASSQRSVSFSSPEHSHAQFHNPDNSQSQTSQSNNASFQSPIATWRSVATAHSHNNYAAAVLSRSGQPVASTMRTSAPPVLPWRVPPAPPVFHAAYAGDQAANGSKGSQLTSAGASDGSFPVSPVVPNHPPLADSRAVGGDVGHASATTDYNGTPRHQPAAVSGAAAARSPGQNGFDTPPPLTPSKAQSLNQVYRAVERRRVSAGGTTRSAESSSTGSQAPYGDSSSPQLQHLKSVNSMGSLQLHQLGSSGGNTHGGTDSTPRHQPSFSRNGSRNNLHQLAHHQQRGYSHSASPLFGAASRSPPMSQTPPLGPSMASSGFRGASFVGTPVAALPAALSSPMHQGGAPFGVTYSSGSRSRHAMAAAAAASAATPLSSSPQHNYARPPSVMSDGGGSGSHQRRRNGNESYFPAYHIHPPQHTGGSVDVGSSFGGDPDGDIIQNFYIPDCLAANEADVIDYMCGGGGGYYGADYTFRRPAFDDDVQSLASFTASTTNATLVDEWGRPRSRAYTANGRSPQGRKPSIRKQSGDDIVSMHDDAMSAMLDDCDYDDAMGSSLNSDEQNWIEEQLRGVEVANEAARNLPSLF